MAAGNTAIDTHHVFNVRVLRCIVRQSFLDGPRGRSVLDGGVSNDPNRPSYGRVRCFDRPEVNRQCVYREGSIWVHGWVVRNRVKEITYGRMVVNAVEPLFVRMPFCSN